MEKLRAGVVGVGYLGRFHAQKYAELTDVLLAGIHDRDTGRSTEVAAETGTRSYTDLESLLAAVDLVSVAVPTRHHLEVARRCLLAGKHVLLEKPIAQTVADAEELIALAARHQLVLQVGHLERFNPAIMELDGVLNQPRFIESHRLSPFRPRGTDVDVVLDLMIHDIDIILNMVRSPVSELHSVGVPVLSREVDIANARLQFENGCVANVTASRVSREAVRKIRIFQPDAYISIDYQTRNITVFRKGEGQLQVPGLPNIGMETRGFEEVDALLAEIRAFVDAVRSGTPPVVSGEDGKRALQLALQINSRLRRHDSAAVAEQGPRA